MRLLIATLALVATTNVGLAGVDYYSGANVDVTFDLDGTTNGNWSPIDGLTDVQASKSFSSPAVRLDGSSSTGGSTTPYDLYFGSTSSDVLKTYSGSGVPSAAGTGVTVTSPGTAGGSYSFSDATSGFTSDLTPYIFTGSGIADGYPPGNVAYFVWHATTTGGAVYATGWANFSYTDDNSSGGNGIDGSGDTFTIHSWAYNLGTSTVIGQTELTNTGVPEPTGLAIIGLVGLAAGLNRRKRR